MFDLSRRATELLRAPALAGVAAAAEAMFPEGVDGAPDWLSTRLVERTRAYLDELPPAPRRLLLMLYVTLEWGSPLTSGRVRRFSRLPVGEREALLRRWRVSRVRPLSIVADAVKAHLTMMYMSHADVLRHVGMYKTCVRPHDALVVPTRPRGAAETSAS